ncbi:adipocyte plasma membrane-associated protein Hemomucin-like [Macrosteles quadrilineatus]|uniref:adipocyte plasma membrane-associated protein Hemomucin-like n=1 Tax=Macrosteles quadrilineatus TaxID=74068 RepID=UPI0023E22384|nr:adipocyte plasma membrane-associated protein Hemomucin-like [Macrosteles quadrilineatus]XP_054262878.1 adipocyte plasma membrane-associated protein Hemomucin-like [Macrosteles quadrilineatus]XP_054262886.1 adipocyte plasma membrane-associated protein Hemomucin-like [Macrosteles quadrilineatus]
MGIFTRAYTVSMKLIILVLAITFIPGIPPDMEFESYSLSPPVPLEGALALNDHLNSAEKLFMNEVKGPEHMEVYNGTLYTTIEGGYVVKIVGEKIVPVVKFGQKCDGIHEPEICGRPLGLSFDGNQNMYVADAYYGIFKVNLSSGEYEQLVSMKTSIDGKFPKLPNSLTVAKDGAVYWSDSSTSHSLHDGLYAALGNGNGRLIKYDPKTKSNTVLVDKLHFANGVALSQDESFILVSDLFRGRILRHYLKGPKKGQTDVFFYGLPGLPDNMHSDLHGHFIVTLPIENDIENPAITSILGPYPVLRKFLARFLYLMEMPSLLMNEYYPTYLSKIYAHWVGSFGMIPLITNKRTTVIVFNEKGDAISSLHSTDGRISSITDIASLEGYYYLGSYTNPYLARVKMRE